MSRAHRSFFVVRLFVAVSLASFVSIALAADEPKSATPAAAKPESPSAEAKPKVDDSRPIKSPENGAQQAEPTKPASDLPPGKVVFAQTDVEHRIYVALDEITEVQYLDTMLTDICNDLELRHSIPVAVDEAALAADGKEAKKLAFTGSIREATLRNALKQILAQQQLTYVVRNDCLIVTTRTAADEWTPIRVYQVHDLLLSDDYAMTLSELICSTVKPESWRAAGGTQGEVKPFVGPGLISLVITQTEDAHEQIAALLNTLREARVPQVLEAQQERGKTDKRGGGFF